MSNYALLSIDIQLALLGTLAIRPITGGTGAIVDTYPTCQRTAPRSTRNGENGIGRIDRAGIGVSVHQADLSRQYGWIFGAPEGGGDQQSLF